MSTVTKAVENEWAKLLAERDALAARVAELEEALRLIADRTENVQVKYVAEAVLAKGGKS